jgi:hypothetical protein
MARRKLADFMGGCWELTGNNRLASKAVTVERSLYDRPCYAQHRNNLADRADDESWNLHQETIMNERGRVATVVATIAIF